MRNTFKLMFLSRECIPPPHPLRLTPRCFQDFVFSFQKFKYDVSWHGFFGFILFRIHSTSWLCRLLSFIKFGNFSAIISSNAHSSFLFLLYFLGPQWYECWYLVIFTQILESVYFSQPIFSLFRLGEVYGSVLKFANSVLCLHTTAEPI